MYITAYHVRRSNDSKCIFRNYDYIWIEIVRDAKLMDYKKERNCQLLNLLNLNNHLQDI
jgi:hypothetical protein